MKAPLLLLVPMLVTLALPSLAFADDPQPPDASASALPIRHVTVDVHRHQHQPGIYQGTGHIEAPPFARGHAAKEVPAPAPSPSPAP